MPSMGTDFSPIDRVNEEKKGTYPAALLRKAAAGGGCRALPCGIIPFIFLVSLVVAGLAVMFLWNKLLPEIFGLPVIHYWQALGLLVLARVFFGGLSHNNGQSRGNPFHDKWTGMSKQEREEYLQKAGSYFSRAKRRAGYRNKAGMIR